MGWARFDDEYPRHPKLQRVPPELRADVIALELAALCYSARVLSDGYIGGAVTASLALEVGFEKRGKLDEKRLNRAVNELISCGRWAENEAGGYQIHDYSEYQPTAEEVKERRKREREKKRDQRAKGRQEALPVELSPDPSPRDRTEMSPPLSPGDSSRVRATRAARPDAAHPHTPTTSPQTPRRGARRIPKKELRRYTGCRHVRGSHGSSYVEDPLGQDRPPADWPHEPPAEIEVIAAQAAADQNGSLDLDNTVASLAQHFTTDQIELAFAVWQLDDDERIRLTDLAADTRRATA